MIKILFWSEALTPQAAVRTDIPEDRRVAAVEFLRSGSVVNRYRGFARCRICNVTLGSCDLASGGFVWPQRAEHYVLKHDVWIDELDQIVGNTSGNRNGRTLPTSDRSTEIPNDSVVREGGLEPPHG